MDVGTGFRARLCGEGFRDEPWGERREGTLRVLCLGDSCTFGLATTWPRELSRILEQSGVPADVLNGGVPGYSTLQGLRLLRGPLAGEPFDAAFAYFGFNDARIAQGGTPDSRRTPPPPWKFALRSLFAELRLFQAASKLGSRAKDRSEDAGGVHRVSLEEFEENLRAMASECARRGAKFAVLTVPSLFPKEGMGPRHPLLAYNERVRSLGRGGEIDVIDVDARFHEVGNDQLFNGLLEVPPGELGVADPIHPSDLGLRVIAEEVARVATQMGLLPAPLLPRPAVPERPIGFAVAAGDVDVDGVDEIGAATAGAGKIRSRWMRLGGSLAADLPASDWAPAEGSVAVAVHSEGSTVVVARFDGATPFVAEVRYGAMLRREDLDVGEDAVTLASLALAPADDGEETVLALPDPAGALLSVLAPGGAKGPSRRVVLQKVERCWSLVAGEILPSVPGPEFVLAPGPLAPREGWLGFATLAGDARVLEGTLAFGHGGFGAGGRLALARGPDGPILAVARGGAIRLFERSGPARGAGWVAFDALFPFGASSEPLHGGGIALALLPAGEERGPRALLASPEGEAGVVLREAPLDGGVSRELRLR